MEDSVQVAPRLEVARREVMQSPEEVAAMLRLEALGWGVRRIARELGCSHMTVRRYLAAAVVGVQEIGWYFMVALVFPGHACRPPTVASTVGLNA